MLTFSSISIHSSPRLEVRLFDHKPEPEPFFPAEFGGESSVVCSIFGSEKKDEWLGFFEIKNEERLAGLLVLGGDISALFLFISESNFNNLLSSLDAIWGETSVICVSTLPEPKGVYTKNRTVHKIFQTPNIFVTSAREK